MRKCQEWNRSGELSHVRLFGWPPAPSSRISIAPLAVIETHPIQYHAPVYRMAEAGFGIPMTVTRTIY